MSLKPRSVCSDSKPCFSQNHTVNGYREGCYIGVPKVRPIICQEEMWVWKGGGCQYLIFPCGDQLPQESSKQAYGCPDVGFGIAATGQLLPRGHGN